MNSDPIQYYEGFSDYSSYESLTSPQYNYYPTNPTYDYYPTNPTHDYYPTNPTYSYYPTNTTYDYSLIIPRMDITYGQTSNDPYMENSGLGFISFASVQAEPIYNQFPLNDYSVQQTFQYTEYEHQISAVAQEALQLSNLPQNQKILNEYNNESEVKTRKKTKNSQSSSEIKISNYLPNAIPAKFLVTNFEKAKKLTSLGNDVLLKELKTSFKKGQEEYPLLFFVFGTSNIVNRYMLPFFLRHNRKLIETAFREIKEPKTKNNILHYLASSPHAISSRQISLFNHFFPEVFNELIQKKNSYNQRPADIANRQKTQGLYNVLNGKGYPSLNELENIIKNGNVVSIFSDYLKFEEYLIRWKRGFLDIAFKHCYNNLTLCIKNYGSGDKSNLLGNIVHVAVVLENKEIIEFLKQNYPEDYMKCIQECNICTLKPYELAENLKCSNEFLQFLKNEGNDENINKRSIDLNLFEQQLRQSEEERPSKKAKITFNADHVDLKELQMLLKKPPREMLDLFLKSEIAKDIFFSDKANHKYNLCLFVNSMPDDFKQLALEIPSFLFLCEGNLEKLFLARLFKYLFPVQFERNIATLGESNALTFHSCNFKFLLSKEGLNNFIEIEEFSEFKNLCSTHKDLFNTLKNNSSILEGLLFTIPAHDVLSWLHTIDPEQLKEIIVNYGKEDDSCGTLLHFGVILKNLSFLKMIQALYPKIFKNLIGMQNEIGLTPLQFAEMVQAREEIIEFLSLSEKKNATLLEKTTNSLAPEKNLHDVRNLKEWVDKHYNEDILIDEFSNAMTSPYAFTYLLNNKPEFLEKMLNGTVDDRRPNFLNLFWNYYVQNKNKNIMLFKRFFPENFKKYVHMPLKSGFIGGEAILRSIPKLKVEENKKDELTYLARKLFSMPGKCRPVARAYSDEDFDQAISSDRPSFFRTMQEKPSLLYSFLPVISSKKLINWCEEYKKSFDIYLARSYNDAHLRKTGNLLHQFLVLKDYEIIKFLRTYDTIYFDKLLQQTDFMDFTPLQLAKFLNSPQEFIDILSPITIQSMVST